MSIFQYYNITFVYPFILYEYEHQDCKRWSVEFGVPTLCREKFNTVVGKDGWLFELKTIHSRAMLLNEDRLRLTDTTLCDDNTKMKAFEKMIEQICLVNDF